MVPDSLERSRCLGTLRMRANPFHPSTSAPNSAETGLNRFGSMSGDAPSPAANNDTLSA
jgi:hypothetical protein